MIDIKTFPSIVGLMDEGLQKEIDLETEQWNTRQWEGTPVDRFPLSSSQIGKCSLALGRNLSHYLGIADYPRNNTSFVPRTKRIYARGHAIEALLIEDMEKYTGAKIIDQQKIVTLFTLPDGREIKGSIDGIAEFEDGTRVLLDYKSKGARHSAGFNDSIDQFFAEMRETGYVEAVADNAFAITDVDGFFNIISFNDFFVDYLLQLNSYGSVENCDFVSLYYENKNTCANYEVRWKPSRTLFDFTKDKFTYIYNTVKESGAEAIPKEFALGSARCRFCEHNARCWGEYTPKTDAQRGIFIGDLLPELDQALREGRHNVLAASRAEEDILNYMAKEELTHIETSEGLKYERKFYNPKTGPYYKLRLVK